MTHTFDWNTLYLTCFVIGFALSVLSFLTMHVHIGHFHFGHGHHAHHVAHAAHASHAHNAQHHFSALNAFTITGFLCWFGGAGYLLHRHSTLTDLAVLALSALCGLGGAAILFWFMTVLMKHERTLEAADTEIVGVLGRISQPILANGIGEMLYTQNGARRSIAVRSEDGSAIPRDTEVVVMSYARGVARVRRWTEFEHGLLQDGETPSETLPQP